MTVSKEAVAAKLCGNCQFFDINDCRGTPVPKIRINNVDAITGFCRASKGLVLGILDNSSNCKQPSGVFKPKTEEAGDLRGQ